ncbi:NTP transferase domain-containing protein [candidate division WOR-3 bacterium]|nr:NTP transferase domain-containing protein [candidate division WOR-3 bacterium]
MTRQAAGETRARVKPFKVIIPAAGEGRRLRPHTHTRPKVLIEVAGKPIIGHIVERILAAGPTEICVVVGYRGNEVSSYLSASFDCPFQFVEQDDPKGLGDAVYRACDCVGDGPVLVMLGDTIVDMDLVDIVQGGNSVGVCEVEDPRRFGVVEQSDGRIVRLVEKPVDPPSNLALVGVYFLESAGEIFDSLERLIAEDRRTRGEYQLTDALQLMIDSGARLEARPVQHWLDCGTPRALLETNRYLLDHSPPASVSSGRPGCVLVPPVFVHESATLEDSVVGPHVSVGANALVRRSVVADSIVNQDAVVEHSVLEHSILGEGCVIKDRPRSLNVGGLSEFRTT